MLNLTRKEQESILIFPAEDLDPEMTVAELFSDGVIEIYLDKVKDIKVRIGIDAPKALNIVRGELLYRDVSYP